MRLAGHDDSLGRPLLYATTRKFLQMSGLKSLRELPQAEGLAPPKGRKKEDEGEAGEVGIRQLACRDNRGENAEEDGTVDPDGGRDTPPEDTEAHLRRPV